MGVTPCRTAPTQQQQPPRLVEVSVQSLGIIDIPSHVSIAGGRSVPSPMLSTTAAKSLADDPPIGNTDNINYSESVQFNFLHANLHDDEEKLQNYTNEEESGSVGRSSRRTNNKA
eukprot:scaffold15044_cov193-Alexandrium_tamarense.AAC.1